MRFLEDFKSDYFADVSLELHRQVMDALRKTKAPVVPA